MTMHPIEQVHKQILSGNVLGPSGTWIPRSEALKRKRYLLKHVLEGEVEIDGAWVKISDISQPPKKTTFIAPEKPQKLQDKITTIKASVAPVTTNSLSPQTETIKIAPATTVFRSNDSSAVPPGLVTALAQTDPPPSESTQESPLQKQTITIRTMSLGKETELTISESRAGTALVAVCSIQGFIDQTNANDFHLQLMSMLDFGVRYFIIDLERTNLIGSAGWGVFAVAARLIKAAQGNLIICSMSPDIEESFLLLQFDEVIDAQKTISDSLDSINQIIKNRESAQDAGSQTTTPHSLYGETFDDLPLQEKIKSVISHNGPLSIFAIARHLKQQKYGKVKISPFRLFFVLKELNLESKWKRVRFYRSC